MENTNEQFARGMRAIALATFLIGTALFAAWYFIGGKMIFVGFGYTVVALLINITLAIVGISESIKERNRNLALSASMLLMNVPAMLFYIWLALNRS
jgi:hypothetical protein